MGRVPRASGGTGLNRSSLRAGASLRVTCEGQGMPGQSLLLEDRALGPVCRCSSQHAPRGTDPALGMGHTASGSLGPASGLTGHVAPCTLAENLALVDGASRGPQDPYGAVHSPVQPTTGVSSDPFWVALDLRGDTALQGQPLGPWEGSGKLSLLLA